MKNKLVIFLFIPLFLSSLIFGEELLTFDAEKLIFHGKENHLEGKDVVVAFRDGSRLCCGLANFSYHDLKGSFHKGIHELPYAVYTGAMIDHKGHSVSLSVQSQLMELSIIEQKKNPVCSIRRIEAEKEVIINYSKNLCALADHAVYECIFPEETDAKELISSQGKIILSSDPGQQCRIIDNRGGEVLSPKIQIDPSARQIAFELPKGTITSPKSNVEQINFKADSLIWEEDIGILTLYQQVAVDLEGLGNLKAELVQLECSEGEEKKLKTCVSTGETRLIYVDETKGFSHTLTSYGCMTIDNEHHRVWLESPFDEHGEVVSGQQVSFHDYMGAIFADTMIVDYEYVDHKLVPTYLKLEGHVRMRNQFASDSKKSTPLEQYALADVVTYDPKSKQMNLSAYPKRRVLYLDKINNIQVSAPALTITRDPQTQKESIKGKGDVRFIFAEQEMERIRKQFGENSVISPIKH